jgi:prepilin-type N-terminal cleavage/methylation domain-containing protein
VESELEMIWTKQTRGFTLVEMGMVVLIFGIMLAIAVPNYVSATRTSRAQSCIDSLKQIDSAKSQYAVENGLSIGSTVGDAAALVPIYLQAWPSGPVAGTYTANAIGTDPTVNGQSATWYTQHCTGSTVDSQCPF